MCGITEHVECTEYIRNAQGCAYWSKKPNGKKYLGRPGLRESNIEMELRNRVGGRGQDFVNTVMNNDDQ